MVSLAVLWLPILLSAVFVFVASSILHMVLPYHRSDYGRLPDEAKHLDSLRAANLQPGLYMFPHCTHKEMKTPEAIQRFKQGPVGTMVIMRSGPPNMGAYLGKWFAYCILISIFSAYVAASTLAPGTPYLQVFRVVGTVAFMAYGIGLLSNAIWKAHPASVVVKEVFDGLIYALLTAGTFGWLWPH